MIRISTHSPIWLALSGILTLSPACSDNGGQGAATESQVGGANATSATSAVGGVMGGSGGASVTGGNSATSGGTTNPVGGTSNATTSSATGGASSVGGTSSATGGNVSTGGTTASSATGGRSSTGGTTSSATGGRASSGGASSTATGGKASTGGTVSTGGTATTGGSVSTGGTATTATGGAAAGGGTATATKFSFFVISYKAIMALSGSDQGFGGDLRYGETGDGAGLRGADKICTAVAERGMPGNGKVWHAYLSTSTVNAIDRIGSGPWYDRLGRTVALTKDALLNTRPKGADVSIINDLPNEDGVPNHSPDGTQVDNHDTLTGTNHTGTLFSSTAHCDNWTSSAKDTSKQPRVGHTWPRGNVGTGNSPGMAHWGSALDESGCGAGVNLIEQGGPKSDGTVGSGGGYGGFYCFAMTP